MSAIAEEEVSNMQEVETIKVQLQLKKIESETRVLIVAEEVVDDSFKGMII
jgi:hypothetical protein